MPGSSEKIGKARKATNRLAEVSPKKNQSTTKPSTAKQRNLKKKITSSRQNAPADSFRIVAIGASAGGLEAFTRLLHQLSPNTGMAFVLVQHLDPSRESALTTLLSRATSMPVTEVTDNTCVEPNHVYVIPPNTRMVIVSRVLKLLPRKKTDGQYRPIDTFLESLAEDQKERAIAVILSGTASDGTLGCEAIKAEGGITLAQDQSAKFDSMPHSAITADCVDFVMPPEDIAAELDRIAQQPLITPDLISGPIDTQDLEVAARAVTERRAQKVSGTRRDPFKQILLLLRNSTGVDFSFYKPNTLQRRIARRMMLSRHNTLDRYLRHLRQDARELQDLYQDMLISVTGFFRNPAAYEVLKKQVWPKILRKRRPDEPVRVWVPGCSTGQEPYSIAMSFLEYAARKGANVPIQIFASDLNDALLDKARSGVYARSLVNDISPERLRRFFIEENGAYRISKAIRDVCIFARQNILGDPPFSRLDLISCRNLLIYLESSTHKEILHTLHYSLRPNGFIFLGNSETITPNEDLFATVDKKSRIYQKKSSISLPLSLQLPSSFAVQHRARTPMKNQGIVRETSELDAQKEADRVMLSKYAPAGVLVNRDLDVLQFRGATSHYLTPAAGRASFNVLKMAREGLLLPLRSTINKARRESRRIRKENVQLDEYGKIITVNIEVIPLNSSGEPFYLILFEPPASHRSRKTAAGKDRKTDSKPAVTSDEPRETNAHQNRALTKMRRELTETRDYLQSVLEEHDASSEELQASNEEVQSANEELQSFNEELETAKEELESANEELLTVNEEMQSRNLELNRLNSDLSNLLNSISISVVLLAKDLTIRRFTPTAQKELSLQLADVGKRIGRISNDFAIADLESIVKEVIETVSPRQLEVRNKSGRWYSLRLFPYLTLDDQVDGAVLILVDIDVLKREEQIASRLAAIVESSEDAILSKSLEGIILTWNDGAKRMFGYEAEEMIGKPIYLLTVPERIDEERRVLEAVKTGEPSSYFETLRVTKDGRLVDVAMSIGPIRNREGKVIAASSIAHNITERKRFERELEASLQREREARAEAETANRVKDEFLAMVSHELRTPLNAIAGWARMLHSGKLDQPTTERAFDTVERNAAALGTIINDLLDTSRIISGKLELERRPINLKDVVDAALHVNENAATAKNIEVQLDLEPVGGEVIGDAVRLEQAIWNLLSNAIKFSSPGGKVNVTLRAKDNVARIMITDNGRGIPKAFLPHVFERFQQGDSSEKRLQGGLGLGLWIARQIVESHKGSIHAESEGDGKGATFTIVLPLSTETERKRVVAPAQPNSSSRSREVEADKVLEIIPKLKLLVVDDEPDTRELVAFALRRYGAEVKACGSAREAIAELKQWRPDLIVSDIGMPGEDGYEMMRAIRALLPELGGLTPAIALTGYASANDQEKARSAGYQAHLAKPVELDELANVVAELVTRKQ